MGRHPYLELADEIDEALRLDDRLAKADLAGFSEAHRRRLRARKAELVSLARADRMTDEGWSRHGRRSPP